MISYEDVTARLAMLGYPVPETEEPDAAIVYAIDRAAEKIRANINCAEIPDGLHCTWADMAAGLFLAEKKATGKLDEAFDFSTPAKRISEGEVSVEYADASDGGTPEARFDAMLDRLINPPAYLFTRFRRLLW